MEGYLQKWINFVYGWKYRYFIIHDGVLIYCHNKGQNLKGTISLKISRFSECADDPLKFIINTGISEIKLRAKTIEEKQNWLNALRKSQQEESSNSNNNNIEQIDEDYLLPQTKKFMRYTKLNSLNDRLAEIWCCQAEFEELISLLIPKIDKNREAVEMVERIIHYANELKQKITRCVKDVDDQKTKMLKLLKKMDQDTKKANPEKNIKLNNRSFETEFQSFSEEEEDEDDDEEEEGQIQKIGTMKEKSKMEAEIRIAKEQPGYIKSKNTCISNGKVIKIDSILTEYRLDSIKTTLLTKNPIFLNAQFSKDALRKQLPSYKDTALKINVWALLKDMINKDLTRIALPVYLNEPISMLQRLCEDNEYNEILDKANSIEDSCLRMCYVVAWSISPYGATLGRLKKPFNPILGETFEYIAPDNSYRYISEQVSHHPPISAGYAESSAYQWWANTMVKTSFWGKSVEATPQGSKHIVLKKYKDHIIYKKPTSVAQNIIIGTMYIDHYGDITFINHTTKDTALLSLTKQGWTSKGAYELNGWVKDKNGRIRYNLKGKWTEGLRAIDELTKQEIVLWTKKMNIPNWEEQYCFTDYTMQMNYLSADLVVKLPATDSRFRPDQRALEHGNIDFAISEKFRLEEKQRSRRKHIQINNQVHMPKWFKEIMDPITNDTAYQYCGGYWEQRESNAGFQDILDLYTQNQRIDCRIRACFT